MRRLSLQTRNLISRLFQADTSQSILKISRPADEAILAEIVKANEPAAIAELLQFVLASDPWVRIVVSRTVHELLRATAVSDLPWLDFALRDYSYYSGHPLYEWSKISPRDLDQFQSSGETAFSLLALASFHRSGYIREDALKRLAEIGEGEEIPFLLLRLNDWVEEIRNTARELIIARLQPRFCKSFVLSLTLISRLEIAKRSDHREVTNKIFDLLKSSECKTALIEALQSSDRFIRRLSYRLLLDSNPPELEQFVRLGFRDDDTMMRRWAAQKVATAFEGGELEALLTSMKRDSFTPVRREALMIAIERNSPDLTEELYDALLDTSASIRELARYQLTRNASIDVAEFYRQKLVGPAPSQLYSLIAGLGETGRADDDRLIVSYAQHPSSKIRKATIKALAALGRNRHIELFMNALQDGAPSVSRQASRALVGVTSLLKVERVAELLSSNHPVPVRRYALVVMERFSKWDSIAYLLRARCSSDEAIADRGRMAVERWLDRFNYNFSQPTPLQVEKMRKALESCQQILDEKTRTSLEFVVKGY